MNIDVCGWAFPCTCCLCSCSISLSPTYAFRPLPVPMRMHSLRRASLYPSLRRICLAFCVRQLFIAISLCLLPFHSVLYCLLAFLPAPGISSAICVWHYSYAIFRCTTGCLRLLPAYFRDFVSTKRTAHASVRHFNGMNYMPAALCGFACVRRQHPEPHLYNLRRY